MPTTLTVADFLSLRMQYKAEQAENEIPAVIEHNFKDGRMVDHYFVVPGPALLADEAVQDFGGKIENILFLRMFLTPCFIEYPNVLILILIPTFFLVAYNDTLFHCNNPLLHLIYDFLVMCNNKYCCSTLVSLFQQTHNLP